MKETICTIPINDIFMPKDGCPICRMRETVEKRIIEYIMGAAMMEPDIRIKTNEMGFCKKHFDEMFEMNNRLSLALMLESHIAEVMENTVIYKDSLLGKDNSKKACEKMLLCAILLWNTQPDFRSLCEKQPYYCIEHASAFVDTAKFKLDKKQFAAFAQSISNVQREYISSLKEDVSWFCKKFDYRYDDEPWGNAKDSVERAIKFLEGDY